VTRGSGLDALVVPRRYRDTGESEVTERWPETAVADGGRDKAEAWNGRLDRGFECPGHLRGRGREK
jgi:hypothetical protein